MFFPLYCVLFYSVIWNCIMLLYSVQCLLCLFYVFCFVVFVLYSILFCSILIFNLSVMLCFLCCQLCCVLFNSTLWSSVISILFFSPLFYSVIEMILCYQFTLFKFSNHFVGGESVSITSKYILKWSIWCFLGCVKTEVLENLKTYI